MNWELMINNYEWIPICKSMPNILSYFYTKSSNLKETKYILLTGLDSHLWKAMKLMPIMKKTLFFQLYQYSTSREWFKGTIGLT